MARIDTDEDSLFVRIRVVPAKALGEIAFRYCRFGFRLGKPIRKLYKTYTSPKGNLYEMGKESPITSFHES
jgi:hypothetical protein